MKNLLALFTIFCVLTAFIPQTNTQNQNNWTNNEKIAFLNECKTQSATNPNATKSQINNYCNCCLEKMTDKYDRPTKDLDMDWFQKAAIDCMTKAMN